MLIEERNINELTAYENNPRINDEAVDYVAQSIKDFGFRNPVIIDGDGVVVCGHTRLLACEKLGINTIPCIVADDLSDEQLTAFRMADNKVSEFATWDFEKIDEELADIKEIDIGYYGFAQEDWDSYFEEAEPKERAVKEKEKQVYICPHCGEEVEI